MGLYMHIPTLCIHYTQTYVVLEDVNSKIADEITAD